MAVAFDKFVGLLRESGIIPPDELDALLAEVPAARKADGEQLARELVKRKKLTAYQAQEVYAGRGKKLVLGNYVIQDKLGQGGMGMVLKAEHRRMERVVALKVMSKAALESPEAVKRFHREVKAAAKLAHPNIVCAYDADEVGGQHFLVMEYVEGSDLSQLVKKNGPLSVEKALHCILQGAKGLEFAHAKGVVHRDIKPANLLLDADGTVKILDMGLARIEHGPEQAELTGTGQIMGTVDYMAPEQAMSTKSADARADIYSLGITLWYLLTGRVAYDGETLMAKLMAHSTGPIPSLASVNTAVRPELDAAFKKMVAKTPAERYQSMTEVISALERCKGGSGGDSSPTLNLAPSEDSKLSAFLKGGVTQPSRSSLSVAVAVAPRPSPAAAPGAAPGAAPELGQTIVTNTAQTDTDPQTQTGLRAGGVSPAGSRAAQPPWWMNSTVLIASGAGGLVLLLLAIWVIIRDKDGNEIARVKVPEGGSVTVQPDPAKGLPPQPIPTSNPSPADVVYLDDLTETEWKNGHLALGKHNLEYNGWKYSFRGKEPKHALSTHPRPNLTASVTYRLDGKYDTFSAVTGIADDAGPQSNSPLLFRVVGDGRELWKSPPVQKLADDQKFSVSVRGIRELRLEVSCGNDNYKAHGVWFEPRLTRAGSAGAAGEAVDLLAMIELPRDALENQHFFPWTREGRTLVSPGGDKPGRILVPYEPPPEYELTAVVERLAGADGVLFSIHVDGHQAQIGFDVFSPQTSGISMIDGQWGSVNESAFKQRVLPDLKQYTIRIAIGKRSVRASVDGREVVRWEGDPQRLSLAETVLKSKKISFGAAFHQFKFHKLELRPLGAAAGSIPGSGHKWPADAPPPAIAPFDAKQAKMHQEAWAKHLGTMVETADGVGNKLVLIPPGEFLMGTAPAEAEAARKTIAGQSATDESVRQLLNNEQPQHRVLLTRPFLMGGTEVTLAAFKKFVAAASYRTDAEKAAKDPQAKTYLNPGCDASDTMPATHLSWNDAVAYCQWVSEQEKAVYRLPTEAEWEYACRAGTTTQYFFGDDGKGIKDFGWYKDNVKPNGTLGPAGGKLANPFGLADMHGNVWEWCQDFYDPQWYEKSPPLNPTGPETGQGRVLRGGYMSYNSFTWRSARRVVAPPDRPLSPQLGWGGFRVVRELAAVALPRPPVVPAAGASAAPPPAIAPFDAAQAKAHQSAWARHLGVDVEFTNTLGMKFTLIPPGEFLMGCDEKEIELHKLKIGREDNRLGFVRGAGASVPRHAVRITRPFYMQTHEVTNGLYQKLLGELPADNNPQEPDSPVLKNITLVEATAFCDALSKKEGKVPAYRTMDGKTTRVLSANGYRLPTEAEWEYACRAGTTTFWFFGDAAKGDDLSDYQTFRRGGAARPNPFGLIDMYGGTSEWCFDRLTPYTADAVVDPFTEPEGEPGVARGGSMFAEGGGDLGTINSVVRTPLRGFAFTKQWYGLGRVVLPISAP